MFPHLARREREPTGAALLLMPGSRLVKQLAKLSVDQHVPPILVVWVFDKKHMYFTTVDLGELSFFTGCAGIQDIENGVTKFNQKTFIETLARRFDAPCPATPGGNLGPRMGGESGGTWPYREAVGALMWLVVWSRVEIANPTRVVAQHANDPTERHWQAVLQIIQYLLRTKDLRPDFKLSVYTDVNFAEKADDCLLYTSPSPRD